MSGDGELAVQLALLAGAAAGGWLVILVVCAIATRPRTPDAGPATMELGPEPPAVVNLITGGWRLGHEAVPATLLDLAGRRVVDIEQTEPDRFVVRLRRGDPPNLLPFERQVYDHVQKLASDGVVAAEALTTGPEEDSKKWWGRFRKSVHVYARQHGLSRPRWPKALAVTLGVLALGPALLAGAAVAAIPETTGESSSPVGAFFGIASGVWFGLMAIVFSLRDDRDTPAGLEAASRWLGVREHLEHDEIFSDLPPAAVAVWDRYIGYGAALDVSAAAVRALPLGAESEREAWSAYGGKWHVVRVRYPRYLPPGWGRHPGGVLFSGLLWGGLAFAALVFGAPEVVDFKNELFDQAPSNVDEVVLQSVDVTLAVLAAALGLVLLRALVMVAFAVPDLFTNRVVEGRVVRVRKTEKSKRPTQVAIDDGTRSSVRAFSLRRFLPGLFRGNDVRVSVSPRLGFVRQVDVVKEGPGASEERASASSSDNAVASLAQFTGGGLLGMALGGIVSALVRNAQQGGGPAAEAGGDVVGAVKPLAGIDAGAVSSIVGSTVRPDDAVGAQGDPSQWLVGVAGPVERAAFVGDGPDEPRVVVLRWSASDAYQRVSGALPAALRRPLAGVGDEAFWFAKHLLVARSGDQASAVVLGFWTRDEDERRDAAAALAGRLLADAAIVTAPD